MRCVWEELGQGEEETLCPVSMGSWVRVCWWNTGTHSCGKDAVSVRSRCSRRVGTDGKWGLRSWVKPRRGYSGQESCVLATLVTLIASLCVPQM